MSTWAALSRMAFASWLEKHNAGMVVDSALQRIYGHACHNNARFVVGEKPPSQPAVPTFPAHQDPEKQRRGDKAGDKLQIHLKAVLVLRRPGPGDLYQLNKDAVATVLDIKYDPRVGNNKFGKVCHAHLWLFRASFA
jgi:hypothetical protein